MVNDIGNTKILSYRHSMKYESYINSAIWVDNFTLSPLSPLVVLKNTRTAIRIYKDKEINPHLKFLHAALKNKNNVCAILCKSSWLIISFDERLMVIETKLSYDQLLLSYPWITHFNLISHTEEICRLAVTTIYSSEIFALCLLNDQTYHWSIETNSDIKLRPIKLRCSDLNLSVSLYSSCIILTLLHTDNALSSVYTLSTRIESLYPFSSLQDAYAEMVDCLLPLFCTPTINYPDIYTSIDPITWSNGNRENQTLWPYVKCLSALPPTLYNVDIPNHLIYNYYGTKIPANSIEFPISSGIYYYYEHNATEPPYSPQNLENFAITLDKPYYPGLRLRTDDSPSTYIPTLLKRQHDQGHYATYVNAYKCKGTRRQYVLPTRASDKKVNPPSFPLAPAADLYILTENKLAIKYYSTSTSTWTDIAPSKPMPNTVCWPYYYKDIIHDYVSVGRYKIVHTIKPLLDGIIDLTSDSTLNIPSFIPLEQIYISATYYQTIRLLLFAYQDNVKTIYRNM